MEKKTRKKENVGPGEHRAAITLFTDRHLISTAKSYIQMLLSDISLATCTMAGILCSITALPGLFPSALAFWPHEIFRKVQPWGEE